MKKTMSQHSAEAPIVGTDQHSAVFGALVRKVPDGTILATLNLLQVAATDQSKAPFVTRALRALTRVAEDSGKGSLLAAASAPSDVGVLLQALDQSNVLLAADDPLRQARIRGIVAQHRLLREEGGVCSAAELGDLLGGLSRQAIDKRRKHGKLIALDLGRHGYRYPVWQIHRGTVLPGLEQVIAELDECDPWTQVAFMLGPSSWLGGEAPLAALRRGEVERVVATAEMFTG